MKKLNYVGFMSELVPCEVDPQQEIIDTWMRLRSVWDHPASAEADIIEVDFAARRRVEPIRAVGDLDQLPARPEALYERLRVLLDELVSGPVRVEGDFLLDPSRSNGTRFGAEEEAHFYGQTARLGFSLRGELMTPYFEYPRGRLHYSAGVAKPGIKVSPAQT